MAEYRDIPGFVGYRVGDDGSVWHRWQRVGKRGGGSTMVLGGTWHPLKSEPSKDGYRKVTLCIDRKHYDRRVHVLVLSCFSGPAPIGMVGRHLDGKSMNCALSNLKWGTPHENIMDEVIHGTHRGLKSRGEKHPLHKLTDTKAREIVARAKTGENIKCLASEFQVAPGTLRDLVSGRTWKCLREVAV